MGKISVVINVVDEEVHLVHNVVASVSSFADEIILVDATENRKIDGIGKFTNVRAIKHKRELYVELARNFGIGKAKNDWILILDPDEEVSKSLAKKLQAIADHPTADYYRVPRKNIIFEKWMQHSRWWPDYNIRFFKKNAVSWSDAIHAIPLTQGKGMDLPAAEDMAIVHHHYDSIEQFVTRMNRYTTAQARKLKEEKYKFSWKDLVAKPTNEFLSRYFFGMGYKDGLHGLAVALLQMVSETVLYLKMWQSRKFKQKEIDVSSVIRQMKTVDRDRNYWYADTLVKESGSLVEQIKRKFKLS